MTAPLRVSLIGASSFAEERLLPAINALPGLELRTVMSNDLGRASDLAERFQARGPVSSSTDIISVVNDPTLDAVIIANRDAHHASAAIMAAKAGKHIFVEKPLALTVEDAEAIAQACAQAGVSCQVGYHQRQVPAHRALRDLLGKGAIGAVERLELHWSSLDPNPMGWRTQTGLGRWWVLAALGTHAVDLAEWILTPVCGAIQEVQAETNDNVYRQGADESARILLRFANGARVTLEISCVRPSLKRFRVHGTTGHVLCRNTLGASGGGELWVNDVAHPLVARNPYEAELEAFAAAIRNGQTPSPNAEDGIRNLHWIEQAHTSALV